MVSPIILTKRQKITLTGQSSGAQTDYQMKLDVVYDSNMNADFSDLRFTKSDGETLLSSWLESKIDSTSAVIWVKTDTPADSSTADIYMYYCNATLDDYWDGNDTFLLFDDFDGDAIDTNKWNSTNVPTVSDGKATFVSVKDIKSTTSYDFAQPCTSMISMDIDAMVAGGSATWSFALIDRNSVVPSSQASWYAEGSNDRYVGGVTSDWWTGIGKGAALGDSRHEITCVDPSNFKWKATGVKTFDDTRYELNNYPDCSTRYFHFSTNYSGCNVSLYWIAVCKYVSNPATVSFGSEEDGSLSFEWTKERIITLTGGSDGVQTDYQLKLNIPYDSDMNSNFSDLRFTKDDGTTLLDAWLEEYIPNTSAVIWIKTDTPASAVESNILMHYGNSEAPNIWDGSNTFLKFDDFEDGSIANWTGNTTDFSASTDVSYEGGYSLKKTGSPSHSNAYLSQAETTADMELDMRVWNSDTLDKRGGIYIGVSGDTDHYYTLYFDPASRLALMELNNGAFVGYVSEITSIAGITTAQWCRYVLRKTGTTWSIYAYDAAGGLIGSITGISLAITAGYVGVHFYDTDMYGDLFKVRKYVENPATYSIEALWYDPGWIKRKKITLTGGGSGGQTDYQVKLNIAYDSDMKSDFSDLRFTDVNGSLIDAWMETYTASTSAIVWVKFPTTPANTITEDYYMYYGNSGAASDWDIEATFIFADDFDDASIDTTTRWNTYASPTETGGEVICTGTSRERITSKSTFQYKKIRSRSKLTWAVEAYAAQLGLSATYNGEGTNSLQFAVYSATDTQTLSGDTSSTENTSIGDYVAAYHTWEILWKNGEAKYYVDDSLVDTDITTVPTASIPVFFESYQATGEARSDWVFVAEYVTDPATYVFGSEENAPGLISDLRVKYTIGELVGLNNSLLYNILKFVDVSIGYESDLASVDRLQLLQIQVHTESTVNVTLDSQSKFNIDGYVLLDIQRVWTIGGSGLNLSQQYNVLNLAPPSDNQRSYCIEGYVNDDIVRSYNIRFPGGYYCKPAIGLNTGIYTPRVIEDLDRKYHNWKVWETKYDFRWKAELYNTETMEGRTILASVQGDYIQLLTETLEVFYRAENVFYTDNCTIPGKTGFDMNGTYDGYSYIDEVGWYSGQYPKGSHEESDVGHKLRLDIIADYPSYVPNFYPDFAETGWTYIFNRNGYLRTYGDESSCGHGFYKIDFLIAGNLDTGLDFEILMDGEVEHKIVNLASRDLGWGSSSIIACRSDDCWHCCDDHLHWVVWSWDPNYVCTKLEYRLTNINEDHGRKRASYNVWGTTDSWTGDPETMTWTKLGSSSISGTFDSTYDELKRVMDIKPIDGCTYILADIRAKYTWLDEDNVFQKSYCLDTTVSEPNFFKMQRITLLNVPCLDEAKFRVIASQIYSHTYTRWIELAHIFITRYKDMGYCQQNVWTHFPALYEWKYLELLRVLSHESTNAYMKLKLWKPTVETDWFGEYGFSEATFYRSSDIIPPSGYESAEWLRWKTWLTSTGAYTPKFYWMSVHSECHDVPMDGINLLQGVTWDAEEATGTMSAGGIDTNSSRLRWCHDINIKANQPAGSIYVDIDESISNGTPYAGTLVVTDAQYPNISTFDDLIEYSSCDDDRFVLSKQWVVKADQNSGKSYVDVSKGNYEPFHIKEDQSAGETYVAINSSVPSDTPGSGIIIVKDSITSDEVELEYSSRSDDKFTLVNTSYNVKINQDAGKLYIDVDATIDTDTPSEGSLKVSDDVLEYTSYSADRFVMATLTLNVYTPSDIVIAAVTPQAYQELDTVRCLRDCMEITLPQTGYINVNGDPMEYTSWEKDRFTVTPATPNDYDKGDGVGIGTPRAYTTLHYVEPQCNVILEGEELAGKWMQIDISGVSTEQVEALVRPAVWLRPDWIAIEIPLNMSWSESVVGKVWSGYCIDQNDAHIVSSEGGYLTLISDRNNTALNIVNTSCMVETNGFFQVFMKGDYEDWEFTMKRVTSDRIFDPGYRQYPSGSSVNFEDVVGSYDLKFWVVPPEDICPKSIAHLDSLATY